MNVIRDSLLINSGASSALNLNNGESDFVKKFAKTMDINKLQDLYKIMNDAYYHMERNCNPKIVFLDTSLRISTTFQS